MSTATSDISKLQRILLLEDDADIRTIASLALTQLGGFSVLACEHGQQALQQAAAFEPQLFLFDVMLPGLDGPGTLLQLREQAVFARTPVIFMTTKTQQQDHQRYQQLGAAGVIAKPFDPADLPRQIGQIWSGLRQRAAPADDLSALLAVKLRELSLHFRAQLPIRLQTLQRLLQQAVHDQVQLLDAIREAHSLAGAGGTFGLGWLSEQMAEVEGALLTARQAGGLLPELADQLQHQIVQVQQQMALD